MCISAIQMYLCQAYEVSGMPTEHYACKGMCVCVCAGFSFNVCLWERNKERSAVCMHFVSTCMCACVRVCAAEVHVWESFLRSGAMEHHIVVVMG